MREILFRGKRKCDGEWVEGDLSYHVHDGDVYIFPVSGYDSPNRYEVYCETVCQYTGLIDKNGRKIWENDIVKHDVSDTIGTVKWYHKDYIGWCVDDVQIYEQQFTDEMWNECEVIGNILDNPELIG